MDSTTTKIPIDLIDDPKLAMRSDTKDESINELMDDMRQVGLIEPIVVRETVGRYEIIAGHRRTTAARLLNWSVIEAKIVVANEDEVLQMRVIENLSRRDVDPVDEAVYVAEIMTRTKKTVSEMAKLVHRSEGWVHQRLKVFEMPAFLQDALRNRQLSLGVALELQQIENENARREYTYWAISRGASVGTAQQWRVSINSQQTLTPEQLAGIVQNSEVLLPERRVVTCSRCLGPCYLDEANTVWVHPNSCDSDNPGGLSTV